MQFKFKKNNLKAFTLAEVLITLAIIGVVAAMTIPTLMTSTRGKEYEVGANKALSTISNALQMRYAMDGVALQDYKGVYRTQLGRYLVDKPGDRPGEQPALPILQTATQGLDETYKLKDGSMILGTFSCITPDGAGGCAGGSNDVAYVIIDTNGEKGPSRASMTETHFYGSLGASFSSTGFKVDVMKRGVGGNMTVKLATLDEITATPADNNAPDIVVFAVHGPTGNVKPAGQRTKNILATGNAMISQ